MTTFHEDFTRDEAAEGPSNTRFGLVMTAVLAILGTWPVVFGRPVRWWPVAVAAVILALAIAQPALLGPPNRLWMRLGRLMHALVTPVVLGVLFYGTITPVGTIMRLAGRDPMQRRFEPDAHTYWIARRLGGLPPETMRRQF